MTSEDKAREKKKKKTDMGSDLKVDPDRDLKVDPDRNLNFDVDRNLTFNLDRPLFFERTRGEAITGRPLTFQRWRKLQLSDEGVAEHERMETAKEYNVKAVQLYKQGKLKDAMWYVDKALALVPRYEKALKNKQTLMKKLAEKRARKGTKQKKSGTRGSEEAVQWVEEEAAYQEPVYTQPAYSQPTYDQSYSWKQTYRCPGCGIPVRQHWVMCTNCGTDLRRYPPVIY